MSQCEAAHARSCYIWQDKITVTGLSGASELFAKVLRFSCSQKTIFYLRNPAQIKNAVYTFSLPEISGTPLIMIIPVSGIPEIV